MQIELLCRHGRTELVEGRPRRLASFEAPEDFAAARSAVTEIHSFFDNGRGAVAECVDDSAPVWIATMPTGFDQGAVRHRPRRGIGIRKRFGARNPNGDEPGSALPIAHD